MSYASLIGMVAGLAGLVWLIAWQGFADVFGLLASSGIALLLLVPAWLPSMLPDTLGWRLTFLPGREPGLRALLLGQWIGSAVNRLLPVATIGGDALRARLVMLWGGRGRDAVASVTVSKAAQAAATAAWGLVGAVLLLVLDIDGRLAAWALAGFGLLALGTVGFILVQQAGAYGWLARIAGRFLPSVREGSVASGARAVDETVHALYRRPGRFAAAVAFHLGAFVVQVGEVWLACQLLGFPIGLVEAVLLRSLSQTLANAAFIIPNGYGLQEGLYVLVGSLVGLPAHAGLAVSLATRVREIVVDVPALLAWNVIEARAALASRRRAPAAAE